MVLPDIFRPGNDRRRVIRFLLDVLREFDVVHTKKIRAYGMIDFDKKKIYLNRHEGFEDDDSILHELRHAYRDFYCRKESYTDDDHELDARLGAIAWYSKINEM
jgi:hypothetical protein